MKLNEFIYDPKAVQRRKEIAFRLCVEENGVTASFSKKYLNLAKEYLRDACNVFQEEILQTHISLIYIFSPFADRTLDGFSSDKKDTKQHDTYQAIGIGTNALDQGRSYSIFVFLHELTHMQLVQNQSYNDHNAVFHKHLDKLLWKYWKATGEIIPNYDLLNED